MPTKKAEPVAVASPYRAKVDLNIRENMAILALKQVSALTSYEMNHDETVT